MRKTVGLWLAAAIVLPVYPASAQTVPDFTGTMEVQGSLAEGDRRSSDNAFYDDYPMRLRAGQRIQVSAESNDFDTMLHVFKRSAPNEPLASDDDGGGGLNSSLVFVAGADDVYVIRVTTVFADETGGYSLRATTARELGEPRRLPPPSSTMEWSTVSGRLTASGTPPAPVFDEYRLRLDLNQQAIIQLESTDFDPMVYLYRAESRDGEPVASDDDSGEGLNSLLVFRATAAGDYVIRVRSLGGVQGGAYVLRVGR